MRTITPTLAICVSALAGAAALLALPADSPSTTDTPSTTESTSSGSPPSRPTSGELVIAAFSFVAPDVQAGAIMPIVNRDAVEHTVTADDGAFDITIASGATAMFEVPGAPGTYSFTCTIHPSMSGAVVVK